MDDERVWERRETCLPKQFYFQRRTATTNFRHLWHSLRRRDILLAVGALVIEAFRAHGSVNTLGQRNVFIDYLALRVSPLLACRHGHAQHVMRVDAVSHASTRRALQALLKRKSKRLGRLRLRLRIAISTSGMRVAPERSDEVREELFRVLLSHCCKLGVPASNKSFERDWPDTLLEDRLWRRP